MLRRHLLGLTLSSLVPLAPAAPEGPYQEGVRAIWGRLHAVRALAQQGFVAQSCVRHVRKTIVWELGVWRQHRSDIEAGRLAPGWFDVLRQRKLLAEAREVPSCS